MSGRARQGSAPSAPRGRTGRSRPADSSCPDRSWADQTAAGPPGRTRQRSSCHRQSPAARSPRGSAARSASARAFNCRWISSLNGSSFDGAADREYFGALGDRNARRTVVRSRPVRRAISLIDNPSYRAALAELRRRIESAACQSGMLSQLVAVEPPGRASEAREALDVGQRGLTCTSTSSASSIRCHGGSQPPLPSIRPSCRESSPIHGLGRRRGCPCSRSEGADRASRGRAGRPRSPCGSRDNGEVDQAPDVRQLTSSVP